MESRVGDVEVEKRRVRFEGGERKRESEREKGGEREDGVRQEGGIVAIFRVGQMKKETNKKKGKG